MKSQAQQSKDAGPLSELSGFQRDLLITIRNLESKGDAPSGSETKDYLEPHYEENLHHGRLYPNLDTLVDKGLVSKGSRDRRTNTYRVTEEGSSRIGQYQNWIIQ